MERFRDFGDVESAVFYEDGAVGIATPSYRQSVELGLLKKELEEYLKPTLIHFSTISTVPNETLVVCYGQTVVGQIQILDNNVITYWRDPKFASRGVMTRAVKLLIDNYTHIKTFRAYVLLDNVRSRQVLLNNNFVSKGISADKFFVNDAWRDHEEFVYTIER
jgi:hypothetical protein